MAHTPNDIETLEGSQEAFEQMLQERLRQAVRVALISVLEEEVTAFIGVLPYECTNQLRDQRNGHYSRDLETTMGLIADLPVPRTRHGYHAQVFDRYHRRREELDNAIGAMFVGGSQYSQGRPGGRAPDRLNAKRLHGLPCVSYARERACLPLGESEWRSSPGRASRSA